MQKLIVTLALLFSTALLPAQTPLPPSPDFEITSAAVVHHEALGVLEWTLDVKGKAGGTLPKPRGQVDGAPVLGYVFPTTLSPRSVGFGTDDGILALAVTSHPDFDDTPLWDENADGDNANDGLTLHTHWVVLAEDERLDGGLAVRETSDVEKVLPATAPGMPLYLDSPGFPARARAKRLQVTVPVGRLSEETRFRFDAVSAYMEVNQSDSERPTLGVYEVYSVLSKDLSLPFEVSTR